MSLRTRRAFALAASAMFVAAACGSSATATPTGTATTAPTGTPAATGPAPSPSASQSALDQKLFATNYAPKTPASTAANGTLLMGEWQAEDTLNLWFSTSYSAVEAMQPAMRGFVAITSDGKYVPDLATTVPTVENGAVVVNGKTFDVKVTLKSGLKWSDGTDLTMDDFVATWKWATDPGQTGCNACAVGWPDIGSIDESTDKLTATIHFKDLYAGWLGFLTSGPWPAKYLNSVPVAQASTLYPVSSAIATVPMNGPFTITNASKTEIDYAPNPNWAGGVSTAHAPYLAGLKFIFYGDKNGEIADFLAGKLDLAFDMTQADYPAVAAVSPSIGTAESAPAWQYEHLDINNDPTHARGQDLWDPAVRKALAMAVNKQDMISVLFPGQSIQPACSPAPPGLWYGVVETCPAYDPTAAQAALTAAGLTLGASGNFQYQGKDLDLQLCTTSGNPTRLTELQKLQGYLAAVHVKSHIKTVDATSVLFATWAKTTPTTDCSIYRGTYDLADFAYVITGSPYNDYYYTYATEQWPEKGDHSGSNDTRFSDPTMDSALTTLKSAVDLQAQSDAAKAVQDAYVNGTPEIPIYYRAETTGVSTHIGNWPGYSPAAFGPEWNVEDWYYQ
ncbi:MAG: ABC transporter substrate-binding protein [Candidatus Limnocylindrales bacterium]